jgi:broad specificity phosphatase PhoE
MTELFLVRHGQADSSGDNYDQLTPVGHAQAKAVGAWLARNGYSFTEHLHGGLLRQKQTLAAIRQELGTSGDALPAEQENPALAEFDLKVWSAVAGDLRHSNAEFSSALKQWNQARHANAANKGGIFKTLTGMILKEWVRQGADFQGAETFPAFQARVLALINGNTRISGSSDASSADRRILAVTSGGPISLITGEILGTNLSATLRFMRRIYNSSLHHFVLANGSWDLVSFNMVPHLSLAERTLV